MPNIQNDLSDFFRRQQRREEKRAQERLKARLRPKRESRPLRRFRRDAPGLAVTKWNAMQKSIWWVDPNWRPTGTPLDAANPKAPVSSLWGTTKTTYVHAGHGEQGCWCSSEIEHKGNSLYLPICTHTKRRVYET